MSPEPRILFQGAQVVSEDRSEPEPLDVLVAGEEVARVQPTIDSSGVDREIDCQGKLLVPALFDLHVHLREPGREDTETIRTGTEAAINGGITGLLAMPNTDPAVDTGSMVEFIQDIAREDARIPVLTAGCITKGREGKELAEIGDMYAKGAPMITDDGNPVANPRVMRRAMEYTRNFDLILADHCEIPELSGEGAVNEGSRSYRLGLPGQPAISEEICVERDGRLAGLTGARLHIHHLSTGAGLESVKRFRDQGVDITCEVTPHHLLFSQEDLTEHDTSLKMNPPLRRPEDNHRLLEGLREGTVDFIATDHAPHAGFEKRQDFNSAPFGITGLETAFLSLYTELVQPGELGWDTLCRAFSAAPRRLLGLDPVSIAEGNRAEFLVFDPDQTTTVDRDYTRSKSDNTPYRGDELDGRIQLVLRRGRVLLDRDELAPQAPVEPPAPTTK